MKIQHFYKLPGLVTAILVSLIGFNHTAQAGMMDEPVVAKFLVDKFEVTNQQDNPKVWELDFWVMQDIQRIVFSSEGETVNGETESENRLVYGHGIAPYWDVQFGLGYDTHANQSHNWGVIGISGMAPYFFETNLHALIDSDGNLGLRASSEVEWLITQRLILVPEISASAYSGDIANMKIGSGLSSAGLGVRLKYEIERKFAPYIGVQWSKNFGNTAKFTHFDQDTYLVAGIRLWF